MIGVVSTTASTSWRSPVKPGRLGREPVICVGIAKAMNNGSSDSSKEAVLCLREAALYRVSAALLQAEAALRPKKGDRRYWGAHRRENKEGGAAAEPGAGRSDGQIVRAKSGGFKMNARAVYRVSP
jgi:hypothetical protein